MNAALTLPVIRHNNAGTPQHVQDAVAAETAVAIEYNGLHYASMMMTPQDYDDFVRGFSLSEGLITSFEQIYDIQQTPYEQGLVLSVSLSNRQSAALNKRRQMFSGRSGCGICGRDALHLMQLPGSNHGTLPLPDAMAIEKAVANLGAAQPLRQASGASHAAAYCDTNGDIQQIREDIGRHNALDKLIGAMPCALPELHPGFVMLSSRASFEMVHKAAVAGFASVIAMSAPTSLAIDTARKNNVNLIGFARPQQYTIYHDAHKHAILIQKQHCDRNQTHE